MAATKDLTAVTLQLEVKNGVDKNDQPKFKNISYDNLDTKATAEQLAEMGKEFGGLMEEAPHGLVLRGQHKKQLEIHRIQVYERREKEGKRTRLIHAYHMASTEYEKTWERAGWYIRRQYGLSHTIVISNGDGGMGYGYDAFQELAAGCKWHEHQRDVYHVHRKVKERLHFAAPEVQEGIRQSIWNHDKTSLALWLDTAESEAEGTDELQDVERLRKYLTRNWTYVEPLNQRQMPEKIHLIQPGACEAGHRIYSYRMKHQGRCWSQEGAEAMVTAHHSHEKRRMGCRVWPQAHKPAI